MDLIEMQCSAPQEKLTQLGRGLCLSEAIPSNLVYLQ
jgi:hypothetical protein